MFYVVVVHPQIPGVDGLDEDAVNSFIASHPDAEIEVDFERILTSDRASREEAFFVAQLMAEETRHPVAVYDDSDVPEVIRKSVEDRVSSGEFDQANEMLNGVLLKHFMRDFVPQSELLN